MNRNNIPLETIDLIVGRGGLLKPIESGVYRVNDAMIDDLESGIYGKHASNAGGVIASSMASQLPGVEAYIADPVVVDEMTPLAHISGHPLFPRRSVFHALNQKAVARVYAKSIGSHYSSLNLIVAHMGGGVSVGAHQNGRVIDVNNALNGSGPFSPERSGTLESGALVEMCFSGNYTKEQIRKMLSGEGGLVAHLGHNNTKKAVDQALDGDTKSKLVIDAFIYNVAKEIGAMSAVLRGEVDAIILTGGIAYSEYICSEIKKYVSYITSVVVLPGEDEMAALASNGLGILEGRVVVKEYC